MLTSIFVNVFIVLTLVETGQTSFTGPVFLLETLLNLKHKLLIFNLVLSEFVSRERPKTHKALRRSLFFSLSSYLLLSLYLT